MQPIKIKVNATRAVCTERPDPITTGMVGLRAEFTFSDDWDGLQKTAVCAGSGVAKDVLVVQDAITVPPECLTDPASDLKIGVYGVNSSGDLVIPTVYAYCGRLFRGADPSGDTSTDYTLPIWAQLQAMMGSLDNLTTTAKENLVAAINEAAKSGGGGAGIVIDSTLTQSGQAADAAVVGNRLSALSEEIAAIPSGADGKSAYQYAQEGGYTGTETEFAAKLAQEKFANPNALTFTGAVSGSYDGSAPLSVEIPSGGGGGGDGAWKHIRKVVIPEDITTDGSGVSFSARESGGYYFAFDTDENGEPFEVGDLFVIYSAGSSSDTSYDAMRSPVSFANRNTPSYGLGSPININMPIAIGKTTTKTYGWAKCEKIGNYLLASGSYNAGAVFYNLYAARTPVSVSSKFTAINAYLSNMASYGFESGSTFDFYGR